MSISNRAKACPSCQQISPLEAKVCVNCLHEFRTVFAAETPTAEAAPPAAQSEPDDAPRNYKGKAAAHLVTIDCSDARKKSGSGGAVLIGGVLCLTGVGALLGVPLMAAGLSNIAQQTGQVMQGECPNCATLLNAPPTVSATNCPECKTQIIVRSGWFYGM